jgi:hypothetical protein
VTLHGTLTGVVTVVVVEHTVVGTVTGGIVTAGTVTGGTVTAGSDVGGAVEVDDPCEPWVVAPPPPGTVVADAFLPAAPWEPVAADPPR